jgi:alcohol dehydrogenase class IV
MTMLYYAEAIVMKSYNFSVPTKVAFGRGRIGELSALLEARPKGILIVTDPGVETSTQAVEKIHEQIGTSSDSVFSRVEANPSFDTVERASAVARAQGTELIIGLGGGSPMDAAKGIALLATNPDGVQRLTTGTPPDVSPLPVVCIPTTAGTGSEVTPFAVFTDPGSRAKIGYGHPSLYPVLALVDPDLSASLPRTVRVDTGLDALCHAVEALLSTEATAASDLHARFAMETVRDALPAALDRDREALDAMAHAAMLAGIAIAHAGTTLLHVMGYPLTVFHGVPHGRASICLLPYYLDFLKTYERLPGAAHRIEEAFGPSGGIASFMEELGVSTRIGDYGVVEEEIPAFVDKVITKDDLRITPAPVNRGTIAALYLASLDA